MKVSDHSSILRELLEQPRDLMPKDDGVVGLGIVGRRERRHQLLAPLFEFELVIVIIQQASASTYVVLDATDARTNGDRTGTLADTQAPASDHSAP